MLKRFTEEPMNTFVTYILYKFWRSFSIPVQPLAKNTRDLHFEEALEKWMRKNKVPADFLAIY